jgi:uncharacterized protein YeaC (DUF1315 family)
MNYEELVRQITPELYATFRRSLEIGRWPDGRPMTAQQREHCLQAVIAYDQLHTPEAERVGYIDRGAKAARSGTEQTLRWASDTEQEKEDKP